MSVLLYADDRSWLQLPKAFPTADGELARQWEDRVVAGMRDAWHGTLDAGNEEVVREALRHGLSRVLPEDSVTLQYWPAASVVNAIVHVVVDEFGEGEVRSDIPIEEGSFDENFLEDELAPVSVAFESEFLGTGVESRSLGTVGTEPPLAIGTLSYLFENSVGYVAVGIDPTLPSLVGILLEPLRDVVRSIRILDDDGRGPWERSSVHPASLPSRGETWAFDRTGESSGTGRSSGTGGKGGDGGAGGDGVTGGDGGTGSDGATVGESGTGGKSGTDGESGTGGVRGTGTDSEVAAR